MESKQAFKRFKKPRWSPVTTAPAAPVVTIIEETPDDANDIDPSITLELSRHYGRGPIELHPDPCYACVKDCMKMLRLDRVRLEEDDEEDEDEDEDDTSAKVMRARKKRKAREAQNRAILLDAAAYLARATCWHNRLEAERPKPGSKAQRWACICGALAPLPTRCDIRRVTCSSSVSSATLRPSASHRPKELPEPFEPAECCPPVRMLPTCCTEGTEGQASCSSTKTSCRAGASAHEVAPETTSRRRKPAPSMVVPSHIAIDCQYERPVRCVEAGLPSETCRSTETSVHRMKFDEPRACVTCLPSPPTPAPAPPAPKWTIPVLNLSGIINSQRS